MNHIKIEPETINKIYEQEKLPFDKYNLDKGYYHLYSYNEKNIDTDQPVWEGYLNSQYYYPNGLIAFYQDGFFYKVDKNKQVNKQQGQNPFQWITIDALLRDEIELAILTGVAGCGKTFLALAYGIEQIQTGKYTNMVLSRPKQDLERDEGFLPGEQSDKILPYMRPFYDNARSMGSIQQFNRMVDFQEDTQGVIFQPLEKIKGRSFENSIVILDEAEDMRYRELESSLTRNNDSKIIICGDIQQVDDDTFSKDNIPLTYAINKMKGQDFFFHINNPITCRKGEVTKFVIDNFSYEEYKNMK